MIGESQRICKILRMLVVVPEDKRSKVWIGIPILVCIGTRYLDTDIVCVIGGFPFCL